MLTTSIFVVWFDWVGNTILFFYLLIFCVATLLRPLRENCDPPRDWLFISLIFTRAMAAFLLAYWVTFDDYFVMRAMANSRFLLIG